jgi:glutamyl-tRNA reductase
VPRARPWPTICRVPELMGVGLSHRTAPLAVRERLALPPIKAAELLRALRATGAVDEAVVLSTCNRTELYFVSGDDPAAAERAALRALARCAGMASAALRPLLTTLRGPAVARHLFAVAAGLESMVLGEAEILGQLRRAHDLSRAAGACGPLLDRLVRDALGAGRRVRSSTAIGRSGVSVSSAAVELAREALGGLADRRVLLVGAGQSSEVTAKVLRSHGVRGLRVANRDHDRAVALAGRDGTVVRFDQLEAQLADVDLVIAATACPHAVIGGEAVQRAVERRASGRPLVLVDLAVPRDIDAAVRGLPGVTLLDLDDVQLRVARNRAARRGELGPARAVLAGEVERFERWRAAREAAPTVAALQGAGDAIVAEVLDRNAPHWESLSAADRDRLATLAHAVARRLLHEPTLRLKRAAQERDAAPARAARELFGLDGVVPARHPAGRAAGRGA